MIEERQRVRRFVSGEREDAFIDRVEDDLRIGGGFAGAIAHLGVELNFVAGLRGGRVWFHRDDQLVVRPGDLDFAVTDPVFRCLDLARAIVRAAEQHDRNENTRRVALAQRHFNRWRVAAQPFHERTEHAISLDRYERIAGDRRLHHDRRRLSRRVAFLVGHQIDRVRVSIIPNRLGRARDFECDRSQNVVALRILAGRFEQVLPWFSGNGVGQCCDLRLAIGSQAGCCK